MVNLNAKCILSYFCKHSDSRVLNSTSLKDICTFHCMYITGYMYRLREREREIFISWWEYGCKWTTFVNWSVLLSCQENVTFLFAVLRNPSLLLITELFASPLLGPTPKFLLPILHPLSLSLLRVWGPKGIPPPWYIKSKLGESSTTEARQGIPVRKQIPQSGYSFNDSAFYSCWGTHMEIELYVCYIGAGASAQPVYVVWLVV